MKLMLSIILFLSSLTHQNISSENSSTSLEILDIKNKQGQICILVFSDDEGYPENFKSAVQLKVVPITSIPLEVQLEDLEVGNYVITVLHDENKNNKVDKNTFGKPVEGYGVSNNPMPKRFGPPEYSSGVISISNQKQNISIRLRY